MTETAVNLNESVTNISTTSTARSRKLTFTNLLLKQDPDDIANGTSAQTVSNFVKNYAKDINLAEQICHETSIPNLSFAIKMKAAYACKILLEQYDGKIRQVYILHALHQAVRSDFLLGIDLLLDNLDLSKIETEQQPDQNLDQSEANDLTIYTTSDIMIEACKNNVDDHIIELLFDYDFRINCPLEHPEYKIKTNLEQNVILEDKPELDPNHSQQKAASKYQQYKVKRRQKENRCTDYHDLKYRQLAAKCNVKYLLLEYEKDKVIYSKIDTTIFGNCLALIREVRWHRAKNDLYEIEYQNLILNIEKLMINLVNQTQNDTELSHLLQLDLSTVRDDDRQQLPLLKTACTYELKELATCKKLQGVLNFIVNLHMSWLPRNFTRIFILFVMGLIYPVYTLCYLFNPHSLLGKASHWPLIALTCELTAEIVFFILVFSYPYIPYYYSSQIIYNSVILLFTIAKIFQEIMEISRGTLYYYVRDAWNNLDFGEIVCLIISVTGRFIWLNHDIARNSNDGQLQPETNIYPESKLISDAFWSIIPVFTTFRLLMMFRINRKIGIIQISFGKMIPDLIVWFAIIGTVLLGFGGSFFLFSSLTLNSKLVGDCDGFIYNDMMRNSTSDTWILQSFLKGIIDLFWIMMSGPEGREDGMNECFGYNWFLYTVCFCLMALFSMMVIIILVNLLIAMMSKTHDSVVEDAVQEREWQFYSTTVWVKFIRREFVAPAPINIVPNFYRHLIDKDHSIFARIKKNKTVKTKDLETDVSELQPVFTMGMNKMLTPEEAKKRIGRYEVISRSIVKRYKADNS